MGRTAAWDREGGKEGRSSLEAAPPKPPAPPAAPGSWRLRPRWGLSVIASAQGVLLDKSRKGPYESRPRPE